MERNGSEIGKKKGEQVRKISTSNTKLIPLVHNQHCYTVHQQFKEQIQLAHNSQVF